MQAPDPSRELDVLIVGAGFSGLYLLDRLRDAGLAVQAIDGADELGGVWYWNCYPGARCDSAAAYYQFALKDVWRDWEWREKYPGWAELRAYFRHVDRKLDLRRSIRFGTWARGARFDAPSRRWHVQTAHAARGTEEITTRHLVACIGHGFAPYVPNIPGLESFAGAWHHTARWPQAGLTFRGKRVGILGTGASGVQVAQEAAREADALHVFQRTPAFCLPMRQRALDAADNAAMRATFPHALDARRTRFGGIDSDFVPRRAVDATPAERAQLYEALWARGGLDFWFANFEDLLRDPIANRYAYAFWKEKVRARIRDPRVAELLAPTEPPHPFGAVRVPLEQDYYDIFNEPHVHLVDLRADPIVRITPAGVRTERREYPLDLLVMATGFDSVTGGLTAIDIRSPQGHSLAQKWADGVLTYKGICSVGFPNFFFTYGPQAPTAFCNGPSSAEYQGQYVADLLIHLRNEGITRIEATPDAERAWRDHCHALAAPTLFTQAHSWYMGANIPGKKREMLMYAGGLPAYLAALEESRARGYTDYALE
ncbi:MAG: flavin-containing monooxygenase [Gammaproteobacteria bacterium]